MVLKKTPQSKSKPTPSRSPVGLKAVPAVSADELRKQYADKRKALNRASEDLKATRAELEAMLKASQAAHDEEAKPLQEQAKDIGMQLGEIQAKHQKQFQAESKDLQDDVKSLSTKIERLTKDCARLADDVMGFEATSDAE